MPQVYYYLPSVAACNPLIRFIKAPAFIPLPAARFCLRIITAFARPVFCYNKLIGA